jgi:hypothetical protein
VTLTATAKDLLVDVYPQVVGSHVDIYVGNVNDSQRTTLVHPGVTVLWPNTLDDPQPRSRESLGHSGLSPESTHAMTTDGTCYSSMQNCTSITAASSVDGRPTKTANEE